MNKFSSKFVRPLNEAENQFLEVLITKFELYRRGKGIELYVNFDNNTKSVWTSQGKQNVKQNIPNFEKEAAKYQQELDDFLLYNKEDRYLYNDSNFPFRFASGGALPIIRIGSDEFYSLFYRTIFPVGWNIANGGCDNRKELINPVDALERELREEVIIFDNENRYIFKDDAGKSFDRPEYALARQFIQKEYPQLNIEKLKEFEIPLKWIDGPDSVIVKVGDEKPISTSGIFLNINALDFGIEIDKIVKIHLSENGSQFDGEIIQNHLVKSPIGLFNLNNLNKTINKTKREFIPDQFYYDTHRYRNNDVFKQKIDEYLDYINKYRSDFEKENYEKCKNKFDLCPVTFRILKRYLSIKEEIPILNYDSYDVFISFGGEDINDAEKVYNFLIEHHINAFLSKYCIIHPDFLRNIDDALEKVKCLIVVASSLENIDRPWPRFEYRSFFIDSRKNKESEKKEIIPFISKINPTDLPKTLRYYYAVKYKKRNMNPGLKKLLGLVKSVIDN